MILPNGWKRVKLGDVAKVTSGGTPSKDNSSYWNGDIPWISALEMHNNFVDSAKLKITKEALEKSSSLAKKDDLLLLTRGSMLWNRIPVCLCMRDVAFNQDVKCIHPNDTVNSKFLLYWFGSMENLIMNKVEGTGIGAGKLATDFILDLNVMVPPLNEQKKIAETLSVWDKAIEKTEKLIEIKETLFSSELNERITETSRKDAWEHVPLEKVVNTVNPPRKLQKEDYLNDGLYPIIDQSKNLVAGWTNDKKSLVPNKHGLIVFGDHTCVLKMIESEFAQGADGIKILSVSDKYCVKFVYYSLLANPVIPEGYKRHFSTLMLKDICFPSYERQQHLVAYFEVVEKELNLLKQQLGNYKKQKQGLMQKLLTGQWRIK
jgi:restriction endonuclease S subunit